MPSRGFYFLIVVLGNAGHRRLFVLFRALYRLGALLKDIPVPLQGAIPFQIATQYVLNRSHALVVCWFVAESYV